MEHLVAKLQFIPIAFIAVTAWVLLVKFVNWSTGLNFSTKIWPEIQGDPFAVAQYHGDKLKATAIIVGLSILAAVIAP